MWGSLATETEKFREPTDCKEATNRSHPTVIESDCVCVCVCVCVCMFVCVLRELSELLEIALQSTKRACYNKWLYQRALLNSYVTFGKEPYCCRAL